MMASGPRNEKPTSRYGPGTPAVSQQGVQVVDAVGAGVADTDLAGEQGVDRLDIRAVSSQAV
jgi:hypothetical protein